MHFHLYSLECRKKRVNELGVCASLCMLLCCRVCGTAVQKHRIEDVNVNTATQRKGMCEARKKPWGQSLKEEGRGEERKEEGGTKQEQKTREWIKATFWCKSI